MTVDKATLFRAGFDDPASAIERLENLGGEAAALIPALGYVADPDLALKALALLVEESGKSDLVDQLVNDEGYQARLLGVLGASVALGDHLVRHPEYCGELADPTLGSTTPDPAALRASLLRSVGADPEQADPVSGLDRAEALNGLRLEYRRLLLRLASRDFAHHLRVAEVATELSDLAAGALEAALAIGRAEVGEASASVRLAVIAMGKCGARELNYVSDVDVVFCHAARDEDHSEAEVARIANRLAAAMMRACSEETSEGSLWPVDAALRPEGTQGSLSRTLTGHVGYYERWAKTWEFQALLKARPIAGDLELGAEYSATIDPMVWSAADRDGFVSDAQAMRRRVIANIPAKESDRQLKLGPGGLRDAEFAIQLLQLVHGRTDDQIRSAGTLVALAELTERGYVGRDDGEALHEAYRFLRSMEHHMQVYALKRTHVVPDDDGDLRRLGRSLGMRTDSAKQLTRQWQHHRREVRRLHEKLFYRPLLAAVARIPGDEVRLSSEAAATRLRALGFEDPQAALRNLEALTSGLSRTATVQKALLPAMLEWFAEGSDPDAGLFGFRRISEQLGRTPWYLKTLRDEGVAAQRLAYLLSTTRYAASLLEHEPLGIKMLTEDLTPRSAENLAEEMEAAASRQSARAPAIRAIRAVRRRELLRIASGEALGLAEIDEVGAGLSRLTDATLSSTLDVVVNELCAERELEEAPTDLAIVAMGRYGGFELSYGSDADVMFVHRPRQEGDEAVQAASSFAQTAVNRLREALEAPGDDPPLEIDADLRPEGRQGALVRTLDAYASYYRRWSAVWEAQALLRADAVVGDADLREEFTAVIDPIRYPAHGASDADALEVRRIKSRVDTERLPRGADPQWHLKLGPGGLSDIEWTVQLLQMRHAGEHASLRTPRTLEALNAAEQAGLLDTADAQALAHAWRTVSRVRNAATLVRGKPSDSMPRTPRERAAVASLLGYDSGETDRMINDYLRAVRVARSVVDRTFWEI